MYIGAMYASMFVFTSQERKIQNHSLNLLALPVDVYTPTLIVCALN